MMVYAILDLLDGEWLDVYDTKEEALVSLILFCFENERELCEFDIVYRKKQCIM